MIWTCQTDGGFIQDLDGSTAQWWFERFLFTIVDPMILGEMIQFDNVNRLKPPTRIENIEPISSAEFVWSWNGAPLKSLKQLLTSSDHSGNCLELVGSIEACIMFGIVWYFGAVSPSNRRVIKAFQMHIYIWVFPKIMVPPNHPFGNRVFHYRPSILGCKIPLFLETPICVFLYTFTMSPCHVTWTFDAAWQLCWKRFFVATWLWEGLAAER